MAKKNLIVDTDLFSDVDDAGALLLAATIPNVNLLAVNVNTHSSYSVIAASAILAHYGQPQVPIGVRRPITDETFFDTWKYELGEYASKVAFHWSGGTIPWGQAEKAWDPVELYRKTLSQADDDSVTIASIGFLDNLLALLHSPADKYSNLNGRALVERKVRELVVMGGGFPGPRKSYNFYGSGPNVAGQVLNTWTGQITFAGDDIGKHVLAGGPLIEKGPKNDPVRMAYLYYGYGRPLSSWDPLTIMYAATGLDDLFKRGNDDGYIQIDDDGTNRWINDEKRRDQSFLRLRVSNETAAAKVDKLFLKAARQYAKRKSGESTRNPYMSMLGYLVAGLVLSVVGWTFYTHFKDSRAPQRFPIR